MVYHRARRRAEVTTSCIYLWAGSTIATAAREIAIARGGRRQDAQLQLIARECGIAIAGGEAAGSGAPSWAAPPGGHAIGFFLLLLLLLLPAWERGMDDDFKAQRRRLQRPRRQQPGSAAGARAEGEGEAGGLRCQLCGRDLALLGAARRQEHANRCLDDFEKLQLPSAGNVFECPICGKGFRTPERRGGHLKRCAARMAIPPPLLLQVVRQQTSAQGGSGFPAALSGLKRKGSSSTEPSTKKPKTGPRRKEADEELLVALAMSRSLHAEEAAKAKLLAGGRQTGAGQGSKNPKAEKKNRAMAPHVTPTLLLQDPEQARQQTEERVALLLSEAEDLPGTCALPPSRLSESELSRRADWPLALPKGPPGSLWERSSLTGPSAPGSFGVSGLTLPALLRQADQRPMQSRVLPLFGQTRPEAKEKVKDSGLLQERACGNLQDESFTEERKELDSSQEDAGTLRDLIELAGEGLTLTQWSVADRQAEEFGQGRGPGNVLQSCRGKEPPPESRSQPFLLGSLAAAFKGMVNNPHLSDIQFQTDRGEVFYAHLFVLYARCPQLMEVVDQTGFLVAEEGAKTRRVLMSDVSGEAARVFLNFLYTADNFIPQHVLSEVAALAVRFGVAELAALCASHGGCRQPVPGLPGREEEERSEKFEELLKSIWVGEEEEDLREEAGRETVVDEEGLEEIYEFAATQRKAEGERSCGERMRVGACSSVEPEEEAVPVGSAEVHSDRKGSLDSERSQHDARKEAVINLSLEEHGPLGAAARTSPEAPLESATASEEPGEKSLPSVSWGESSAFPRQSSASRESLDGAPGDEAAARKSPTPLELGKGSPPVSRSFSSGDSQALPVDRLPATHRQGGRFCREVSPALFSPTQQEAAGRPRQVEERGPPEATFGAAADSGADNASYAPAPLRPASPVSLLTSDSDEEAVLEGRKPEEETGWPVGTGAEPGRESGATEFKRGLDVGISCCRKPSLQDANREGTGEPWLGKLPCSDTGGERISSLPNCSGSEPGPKLQQTGDSWDGHPAQKSPATPPSKTQPLQGFFPRRRGSPTPCSPACRPRDGKRGADVVIVVDDSEEEREAAPNLSWGNSVLEEDHQVHRLANPEGSVAAKASGRQEYLNEQVSPPRTMPPRDGTPPGGSRTAGDATLPLSGHAEEERCSGEIGNRRLSFWDWSGDEMEVLPLTQRVSTVMAVHSTPAASSTDRACRERGEPCPPTPPTPMPSYSIMETPELKNELNRFGVRKLPKRQMVVKLKEIFQYTHRRTDAEDEASASQPVRCCGTQTSPRARTSPKQKRTTVSSAEVPDRLSQALTASQETTGFPVAVSDNTLVLLSSSPESETSTPAGEEDDVPSSQPTRGEVDTLAALRRYIRSQPALCRQILLYQPFELARLQSELKQSGIRIGLGRLLEFLDTHGITFTTAEARREKKQQKAAQRQGRRRC